MTAIFQAYVKATQYKGLKIDILLETGSHYLMPSGVDSYHHLKSNNTHIDFVNPLFDLTIRPLKCNDMMVTGTNFNTTG